MIRSAWLYGGVIAALTLGASPSTGFTRSEKENRVFPSNEVRMVQVRNLQFTDFVYRGSPTEKRFTVRFEKRASEGSEREMKDVLSQIGLETRVSGSTLEITLRSPRRAGQGILDRCSNARRGGLRSKSPPSAVDADIQADSPISDFVHIGEAHRVSGIFHD